MFANAHDPLMDKTQKKLLIQFAFAIIFDQKIIIAPLSFVICNARSEM